MIAVDQKISVGTIVTLCLIAVGSVFAMGQLMTRFDFVETRAMESRVKAIENETRIEKIDKRLIVIETKLDAGFEQIMGAIGSGE